MYAARPRRDASRERFVSDQERLEIGQTFGRYQIVRVLGEGGMGVVYEALHLGLKKRFAVKTLRPSVARIPEAQVRFLREGEAASRIHHPHVVNVVDVGTEGGIPFLVMEFLEGLSLAELIEASGRMDVERSVSLLLPAVSAVAAGHAQGVVHRDLKPANVFIARGAWGESITKVLDFGVSKLMAAGDGTGLTATASVLGTAAYMSPEQAMGLKDVDGRSDQFALGQILYEMLTGARAHAGENQFEVLHNIATGKLQPPRQRRPDLPPALEDILLRMLAFSPADRYASLLLAGRALLPYADDKMRATLANAFKDPAADSGGATQAAPPPTTISHQYITTFQETAAEVAGHSGPGARASQRAKMVFALIAGVGIAGSLGLALSHRTPSPTPAAVVPVAVDLGGKVAPPSPAPPPAQPTAPEPRTIDVRVVPPQAAIVLDDQPAVSGHLQTTLPGSDRAAHVLRISAPGHHSREISFGPGTAPPPQVTLELLAKPGAAKHASHRGTPRPAGPAPDSTSTPRRGTNDALIIH
jgi:serine/threonine-protein kinase